MKKKHLKLKKEVKTALFKISLFLVAILYLTAIFSIWNAMLKAEYQDAIERCGSEANIITLYTKEGDAYYKCKMDK